jgi:hypothetical protein
MIALIENGVRGGIELHLLLEVLNTDNHHVHLIARDRLAQSLSGKPRTMFDSNLFD